MAAAVSVDDLCCFDGYLSMVLFVFGHGGLLCFWAFAWRELGIGVVCFASSERFGLEKCIGCLLFE